MLQAAIRSISADTAVITLTGPLTLGTSLKSADMNIGSAIDRGVNRLVVDLTGVPYMDSAGLGALMHAFGLANEKGGSLRLAGVNARVLSLLRMTRVEGIIPMDPDAEASLTALGAA